MAAVVLLLFYCLIQCYISISFSYKVPLLILNLNDTLDHDGIILPPNLNDTILRVGHRTHDCQDFKKAYVCIMKCLELGYHIAESNSKCTCTCYKDYVKGKYFPGVSQGWTIPSTSLPPWVAPTEDEPNIDELSYNFDNNTIVTTYGVTTSDIENRGNVTSIDIDIKETDGNIKDVNEGQYHGVGGDEHHEDIDDKHHKDEGDEKHVDGEDKHKESVGDENNENGGDENHEDVENEHHEDEEDEHHEGGKDAYHEGGEDEPHEGKEDEDHEHGKDEDHDVAENENHVDTGVEPHEDGEDEHHKDKGNEHNDAEGDEHNANEGNETHENKDDENHDEGVNENHKDGESK